MAFLEDIIITIDTREQNTKRINAVNVWGEKHGALIERSNLYLCDYHILGEFRGCQVNLGIEAKSLADFSTSYQDLPDKLARAYKLYNDVGLFVETNNYSFAPNADDFHAMVRNPAVTDRTADVLPLAVLENMMASLQSNLVHVRQLRSEFHFPYAIGNLLLYITKPEHSGLFITKEKNYISEYQNVLMKLPNIGGKRALQLQKEYPSLHWLCSSSEDELKEVVGKLTGKKLYQFIHNQELCTDEWRNRNVIVNSSHPKDGLPGTVLSNIPPISTQTPAVNSHGVKPQTTPDTTSHSGESLSKDHVCALSPDDKREVSLLPPATPDLDLGLDGNKYEYKEIERNVLVPDDQQMNLKEHLKLWFNDFHTMEETVQKHSDWTCGRVFDVVMGGIKKGYLIRLENGKIIRTGKWELLKKGTLL